MGGKVKVGRGVLVTVGVGMGVGVGAGSGALHAANDAPSSRINNGRSNRFMLQTFQGALSASASESSDQISAAMPIKALSST